MREFSGYIYIDSYDKLKNFIDKIDKSCQVCGLDLEADSLYSYEEKLCLIQFIYEGGIVIIDPLKIDDKSFFLEFLDNREVWMHGADYDFYILKNTFGDIPSNILDTQVAAKLCGVRSFSLANLVKNNYAIDLPKGGQKANWKKRPISEKLLDYAANDVRYLLDLGDYFKTRLHELGRYSWFEETCRINRVNILNKEKKNKEDLWRIKGSGDLDRRSLFILKQLWLWRDNEAKYMDLPHFRIVNNSTLISFVHKIREDGNIKINFNWSEERKERFYKSVETTREQSVSKYPEIRPLRSKKNRKTKPHDFSKQLDVLIKKRDKIANKLSIDPTLIASYKVLENYILNGISDDGVNISPLNLLNWQKKLLGV